MKPLLSPRESTEQEKTKKLKGKEVKEVEETLKHRDKEELMEETEREAQKQREIHENSVCKGNRGRRFEKRKATEGQACWGACGVPPPRQSRVRRDQRQGKQKGTVLSSTCNTSEQHKPIQ